MLNKLFFKKNNEQQKKYGGIIAALKLEEFWGSLLPEEREFIRECYTSSLGGPNPKDLDNPKVEISITRSASGFLSNYAGWAINKKRYELSDKLLQEAIRRNENVVDLHFTYNSLIDLCYKRRNESPEWIERCIKYCLEDISIFPEFKEEYLKEEKEKYIKQANSPLNKSERKKNIKNGRIRYL
ncbi:MAG: hypothetical protein ACOY9Y_02205 [Bacillota bacterium]